MIIIQSFDLLVNNIFGNVIASDGNIISAEHDAMQL